MDLKCHVKIKLLWSCCDESVCMCRAVAVLHCCRSLGFGRQTFLCPLGGAACMCKTVYYKLIIDMCSKVITDWQTVCLQTVHTIVYVQSNCGLHSQ